MKLLKLLNAIRCTGYLAKAQMPAAIRFTNWAKAGSHANLPTYYHILFPGDPTGVNNNSAALQAILDTITKPTIGPDWGRRF
jgi:hypothetical protein